ncbi:MAG: hypothetical protein PHP26_05085 [Syntrophomonas sp.]|nr:hypothetical protein [Syntrophomonas sp.]
MWSKTSTTLKEEIDRFLTEVLPVLIGILGGADRPGLPHPLYSYL